MAIPLEITDKRLRSALILGIGVVLFPNTASYVAAMFLFLSYDISIGPLTFFSFDFSVIFIMATLLWHLDRENS